MRTMTMSWLVERWGWIVAALVRCCWRTPAHATHHHPRHLHCPCHPRHHRHRHRIDHWSPQKHIYNSSSNLFDVFKFWQSCQFSGSIPNHFNFAASQSLSSTQINFKQVFQINLVALGKTSSFASFDSGWLVLAMQYESFNFNGVCSGNREGKPWERREGGGWKNKDPPSVARIWTYFLLSNISCEIK